MMCDDLYKISHSIRASNFKPHRVIGISRGGLIPGVCLSHTFECPFIPLQWATRDGEFKDKQKLNEIIEPDLPTLFVDDICDTGLTLREIEEEIGFSRDHNTRFTTLIYNITQQDFIVDFYGRLIDRDKTNEWVNFWWEK